MKEPYKIRLFAAIIVFALMALGFSGLFYPVKLLDLQFAPLAQRVLVDFSIVAAVLFGGIILLTLIFGRFYCSLLCPFGTLQEILALLLRRKKKETFTKSYPVKYFLAAVVFGALIGGSALLIRFLEPYTFFGSTFTLCLLGGVAVFAVLALVFFKNRFFCANICPVGAILGLLSKIAPFKIYIPQDICVSCGACEKVCPVGCINSKEKTVNNAPCIKCFKCLEACPQGGLKFGLAPSKVKFSPKRRDIILSAAVLALFGGMIKAGIALKDSAVKKFKEIILPPGSGSAEEFADKCFNCNLCVQNCPNKIISKADETFPAVHINLDKSFCKKDCKACGDVCPTGAIKRLTLEEKQKTRIGMAAINAENCTKCGLCVINCPYEAISREDNEVPVIDASKCVGCGRCKTACKFDAIEIYAVKKQNTI